MSPELTVAVDAARLPGRTKWSWRYCNIPMIEFVLYKKPNPRPHPHGQFVGTPPVDPAHSCNKRLEIA